MSPTLAPNNPFPIGEFTDNLPFLTSVSESATKRYLNSIPFAVFLITTLECMSTLEVSN